MNLVSQTRFGGPLDDADLQGDCWAACVASVLELPLDAVPNFTDYDWYERWQDWLAPRNLRLVTIPYKKPEGLTVLSEDDWPRDYAILSVDSRSLKKEDGSPALHAVVWHDGKIVWDPSPVSREKGPYMHRDDGELIEWRTLTVFQVLDPSHLDC